jgi:MFS family permease
MLGFAPTLPSFLVGTLVRTVGTGTLWVFSAVILQMIVPDEFRGRVFAFEFAVLTLTQSISTLAAGTMQDVLGWHVRRAATTMGWLGIGVTGIWVVVYLFALPKLKQGAVSSFSRTGD